MSIFNSIPVPSPKYSKFNLSFRNKMSAEMGMIYPFAVYDCIPGDKFKINTGVRVRLQALIAPVLTDINVFVRWFFVPNRLLWDQWQDFITAGDNGLDEPIKPQYSTDYFFNPDFDVNVRGRNRANKNVPLDGPRSLADYLNFPVYDTYVEGRLTTNPVFMIDRDNQSQIEAGYNHDLMPFKAYQLIWNEYFRDQNLQQEVDIHTEVSGVESYETQWVQNLLALQSHAWEKDYFTSALPWAQRGEASSVGIPDTLPVVWDDSPHTPARQNLRTINGELLNQEVNNQLFSVGANANPDYVGFSSGNPINIDLSGTHVVDASGVGLFSIQSLRLAAAVQRWLENNARSGSRYVEQILSRFGVRVPDYRLDRPEYLGGGMFPVNVSEVLQTSSTTSITPLGNMAGHGIGSGSSRTIKYNVEEHGWLMGLLYVQPRSCYQQGLPRMYSRNSKFDYYNPEFQHLGEQEILNKEIYIQGTNDDDATFGYTPRFAEYKFKSDEVHGDLRTNMSYWHLGRKFATLPALNGEFVAAKPRTDIFAVSSGISDGLIVETFNQIYSRRPMSMYGTPSSII